MIGQVLQQGLGRGRFGGHLDPHRLIETQEPALALQQLQPGPHCTDPVAVISRGQHRGQAGPQLLQLQQVLRPDPLGIEADRTVELIEAPAHHPADGALVAAQAVGDGGQGLPQGPQLDDLGVPLGLREGGLLAALEGGQPKTDKRSPL